MKELLPVSEMREFLEVLNLGNGDKSIAEVEKLMDRLRFGVSMHSGLSQGQGHISDEEMERGKREIAAVIADITTALGADVNKPKGEVIKSNEKQKIIIVDRVSQYSTPTELQKLLADGKWRISDVIAQHVSSGKNEGAMVFILDKIDFS